MRPLRIVAIILVFITLSINLVTPTGAAAQQSTNCFKLTAANCKIYTTAIDNIIKLTTFQPVVDLTVDYRLNDQSLKYVAKGTGAVDLSEGVLDAMETGDQKKLVEAIKFSLNIDGTQTTIEKGKKTTTQLAYKLILLDGYIHFQTITDGKASAWITDDLATYVANAEYIQAASSSGLDAATQAALDKLTQDPEFIAAMAQLPRTPNFLTLSRTGTSPLIDKQKMIEFAYVYDFALLFRTREMNTIVKKYVDFEAERTRSRKFTATQVNLVVGLLSSALNGTTLKIKPWVGTTDNLFHALTIEGAFNFRGSAMYLSDNLNAKITLKTVFDKIGEPVTVSAPE